MNLFGGLPFLQGHITNVALARQLAGVDAVDGETEAGRGTPQQADRSVGRSRRTSLRRHARAAVDIAKAADAPWRPVRHRMCHARPVATHLESVAMAKGLNKQKEQKKKPAKTAKEKKAEKNEKKTTRGFAPV